jgi:hypothetical protein
MLLRRRTAALAALATVTGGAFVLLEVRHVWRRGSAGAAARGGHYLRAGRVVGREFGMVLREGYRASSTRENALLNMLLAFVATFGAARLVTHTIRTGSGPFRNIAIAQRHIHHFVPGMLVAFTAGGLSIGLRREELDKWLALPFGAGVALVFDEAALLLELEDVYWSPEGVISVQITLGTACLLATLGLAVRLLRRGEIQALDVPAQASYRRTDPLTAGSSSR